MDIPLPLHLSIHFLLAVVSSLLAGYYFKEKIVSFLAGIVAGFFIDLDHALEYLLVFKGHFNFQYFFEGRQFLTSEQLHLWFHAWELVPVLFIIAWLFRRQRVVKIIAITMAFAGAVHLATDVVINQVSPKFYLLGYRASRDFQMKNLMTPGVYQENLELKAELGIK